MTNDNNVYLPKEVFILNILAMGVAIQLLSQVTGESIEELKQKIGQRADDQRRQLSPEEIQAIIDGLEVNK